MSNVTSTKEACHNCHIHEWVMSHRDERGKTSGGTKMGHTHMSEPCRTIHEWVMSRREEKSKTVASGGLVFVDSTHAAAGMCAYPCIMYCIMHIHAFVRQSLPHVYIFMHYVLRNIPALCIAYYIFMQYVLHNAWKYAEYVFRHACLYACMYAYVCIYVCMHIHTSMYVHTSIYTYIHTYIHTYMYKFLPVYINIQSQRQIHACIA